VQLLEDQGLLEADPPGSGGLAESQIADEEHLTGVGLFVIHPIDLHQRAIRKRAFEVCGERWMLARHSIRKPGEIAYRLARAPLEATVVDLVRIAGRHRKVKDSASRARRPSAAWTSTKCAATNS
jgi:hypothetical protein